MTIEFAVFLLRCVKCDTSRSVLGPMDTNKRRGFVNLTWRLWGQELLGK